MAAVASVGAFARGDFWDVALPGYVTGIGTLALAVVAYLTMVQEASDRRALQQAAAAERARADAAENRELVRLRARERRAQAQGVQVRPVENRGGTSREFRFAVRVDNNSADSIFALKVGFRVEPGSVIDNVRVQNPPERLVPGQCWDPLFVVRLNADSFGRPLKAQMWLIFSDAAGVRWVRDAQHRLAEVTPGYEAAFTVAADKNMDDVPPTPSTEFID